jgi:hypothetical protein
VRLKGMRRLNRARASQVPATSTRVPAQDMRLKQCCKTVSPGARHTRFFCHVVDAVIS